MTSKTPLIEATPPRGTNEPQPTPQSVDVRTEIERAEDERIARLEARYHKALGAALSGDPKATKELAQLAGELGWSPERIGADQQVIESFRNNQQAIKKWNTDGAQAEYDQLTQAVIDHGTERDALNRWKEERNRLLNAKLPLKIQREGVDEARKRNEQMLRNPRFRALLEAAGLT